MSDAYGDAPRAGNEAQDTAMEDAPPEQADGFGGEEAEEEGEEVAPRVRIVSGYASF